MRTRPVLLTTVLIVSGCGAAPQVDIAADVAAVRARSEAALAAEVAKDADGSIAFSFTSDAPAPKPAALQ